LCFLLYFLCSCYCISVLAESIILSPQEIERIGVKVFENECAGKDECLLEWNEGEDFLSLGIGHFIWYSEGKEGPFEESFPIFVRYLKANWKQVPDWLNKEPFPKCPWTMKEDFLKNRRSPKGKELYKLLIETKSQQSAFLVARLDAALPLMLRNLPEGRDEIKWQFNRLASTPQGIFVLIDYVNFKGLGVYPSEHYQGQGWGLLQVLSGMKGDENGVKAIEEFVQIADKVLTERVLNAPANRNEQRWLPGWQNRVKSYLERKENERESF
jgi:hypothetical protein